jgi:hypothetical protein
MDINAGFYSEDVAESRNAEVGPSPMGTPAGLELASYIVGIAVPTASVTRPKLGGYHIHNSNWKGMVGTKNRKRCGDILRILKGS